MIILFLLLPMVFMLGIWLGGDKGRRNGMARALNLFPADPDPEAIAAWKNHVVEEAGLE